MIYECVKILGFDEITLTQLTQMNPDLIEVDGDFREVRVFRKEDDLKEILGEVVV